MDRPSDPQAVGIYQMLLDRIDAAYAARDYGTFRPLVVLPQRFVTPERVRTISTEEGLRTAFLNFADFLRSQNVDGLIRHCRSAHFRSPGLMRGMHVTHMVSRSGIRLQPPYEVLTTLRYRDGDWRVSASLNRVPETGWPVLAMKTAADHIRPVPQFNDTVPPKETRS
ncbi:hypothetical protein MWU52_02095 [Jannaschia sp. S6380]|uniref:hypothetical protein n=1 Tax=Jannaschia sp. S6380 TaxID=2926408 RepID=UPI001FF2A457|nr:hypothetical protein [Jannaschia sp. S6380]MCK0166334.1 hypothetical protein [Jannaschia sp. S6380]